MIFTLALSAFAASYDVELAVPSQFPTSLLDNGNPYTGSRMVRSNVQVPDMVVASSDSRVTCILDNQLLSVHMRADDTNWPTAPFSATCTYGGDTLQVDVVWMSAATDPALQAHNIDTNDTVTYTRVSDASASHGYILPDCAAEYVDGVHNSTIGGVRCRVDTSGSLNVVNVDMKRSSNLGVGTCNLPLSNGSAYTLNLDLSEAAI